MTGTAKICPEFGVHLQLKLLSGGRGGEAPAEPQRYHSIIAFVPTMVVLMMRLFTIRGANRDLPETR